MVFDITSRHNDLVALPSWTANGGCTKILSIEKNGFFGEGRHCDPVKMRLRKAIVPYGIDYTATITARRQSDGPVTLGRSKPSSSVDTKAT